jgi:hypothetical protein
MMGDSLASNVQETTEELDEKLCINLTAEMHVWMVGDGTLLLLH